MYYKIYKTTLKDKAVNKRCLHHTQSGWCGRKAEQKGRLNFQKKNIAAHASMKSLTHSDKILHRYKQQTPVQTQTYKNAYTNIDTQINPPKQPSTDTPT